MTEDFSKVKKSKKARRAGQIISRGENKWLVRVFLGRDTLGKKHYHSQTVKGNKRVADRYLNEALHRLQIGEPLRESEITFGEFLDQWLNAARLRVRERTHTNYTTLANTYFRPELGNRRLVDIQPADIQSFYFKLKSGGLSGSSLNLLHVTLGNAFKMARKRDMIRRDPMIAVESPRRDKREMQAMTGEQIKKLLATAGNRREAFIFEFAFFSGARPCEYLGMKWSDLDLKAGTVTFQRSIVWRKVGDWYLTEPKTAGSRRTLPLTPGMIQKFADYRARRLEDRMKAGSAWRSHDFVFTDEIGEPVVLSKLHRAFKALLIDAGLPEFRLYDARHSCATTLMGAGVNPKVVSERLGHSSVSITLGVYSHVSAGMQQDASEQLEKALLG